MFLILSHIFVIIWKGKYWAFKVVIVKDSSTYNLCNATNPKDNTKFGKSNSQKSKY